MQPWYAAVEMIRGLSVSQIRPTNVQGLIPKTPKGGMHSARRQLLKIVATKEFTRWKHNKHGGTKACNIETMKTRNGKHPRKAFSTHAGGASKHRNGNGSLPK